MILSDNISAQSREIVLKKYVSNTSGSLIKLGHVFNELPYGIIHKLETGIGATTLELNSKRNSIIVEPLKVTASTKAVKHKEALYVGSSTKQFPNIISKKTITDYLNNKEIKYKKFLVVADSLPRLLNIIGTSEFNNYFIMIDEIDSFQLGSTFRKSMENCLDYYKEFPKEQRAMVTATPLEFSDPELAEEFVTQIKYEQSQQRNIETYCVENIKKATILKVISLLKNYPNQKIVVAFNSINGCLDIANNLIKKNILATNEIKILCGKNSENLVGNFWGELEKEELPAKLTFCTSAYFTGFDISERYHLVSVSGNENPIHTLSYSCYKQIAGRCRSSEGVLSDTIIYDVKSPKNSDVYSKQECINMANVVIDFLNHISTNYKTTPFLKSTLTTIYNNIVEFSENLAERFVRKKNTGEPAISYFNIDAFLEEARIRLNTYADKDSLPLELLEAGHLVTNVNFLQDIELEKNVNVNYSRINEVDYIVKLIQVPGRTFQNVMRLAAKPLTDIQKYIVENYIEYKQYIDKDKLLELIHITGKKRDFRALKNLFTAAHYFSLNPLGIYKKQVQLHLPIGERFTSEELLHKWNIIFEESDLQIKIETTVQAVRWSSLHFKINKSREPVTFLIADENPCDLTLIRHRSYIEDKNEYLIRLLVRNKT